MIFPYRLLPAAEPAGFLPTDKEYYYEGNAVIADVMIRCISSI